MKYILGIFFLFFLSACAPKNPLGDFRFQTVVAPPYVNASWHKITKTGEVLKIYIEGDGTLFNLETEIENPTPKSLFLRRIAANDPAPNVAYLARPCQYFQAGNCSLADWTSGRYSKSVIDSMDRSVSELMKKAKAKQVILIGYDGGAQIAGQIAVRHPERVMKIYTLAGILDHEAWRKHHQLSSLSDSENLIELRQDFLKIPQHHFAGGKDDIVPVFLIRNFVGDKNLTVIEKATHDSGYQAIYPYLYQEK